ncbi:CynX/NimT family MFS transporter [Burkholderia sp. L27(2015)]|uniref:MFS transporter n=1 Tax=Burkholderia sp. L27(2015) TaxID=1641858 RepID=UPI001C20351F|nr:MFS transporter [Burkholderia sp. L27(2015)]
MKNTSAMTKRRGDVYDVVAMGSSMTEVRDVKATHEKSADAKKAAWLVVAMVVIAMALRPGIASIGPVLPLISREFSLSHATASLLTTIPSLLMGLLALPTPWLARRFGRNGVLLASLVLLFVSMVARTFVSDVAMLLLTTAGVGAGIAISGTLFAGVIKARFPTKVAMMMSIYATALAGSTTISAAATGPIAAFARANGSNGWRVGTGIWSPVALIAIVAALAILVWERRELATATAKAVGSARLPLMNRTAWLVALFFACDNFLFFALLAWTSPMYREYGLSASSAGLVLATYTVAFTVGIPVFGFLSRVHDRRRWLAVCAALSVAGTLGMALAPLLMPHGWIAIAAFGVGGGFTLGMTLPLDSARNADEANTWNAFVMTVGYLLAAAGPLLVGLLRDATGAFAVPSWLLFVVALGMLVLTPFLAPRKHEAIGESRGSDGRSMNLTTSDKRQ